MSRRIIAGLNGIVILFWLAFIVLIAGYVLHEDLTSDGLRRTQAFLVLGYFLYPLFYGGVAYLLVAFASMYRRRGAYIGLQDTAFAFGRRIVPFSDVRQVDVRRNWLGLKQLVVVRNEARDYRLAAYALSRPVDDVAADLRAALTQTPR